MDPAAISHLLQGYKAASDEPFVAWVKRHHDNIDDGNAFFTPQQLMQMARCKYADSMASSTWACPNADQAKLIALTSIVSRMSKSLKKPEAPKKGGKNPLPTGSPPKRANTCPEDKWKYVGPGTGEPQTKNRNNKQYHWCLFHNDGKGMWTLHLAGTCTPEWDKKAQAKPKKDAVKPKMATVEPKVKFNVAMMTIEEVSDSD